jgi:hypothetical protein
MILIIAGGELAGAAKEDLSGKGWKSSGIACSDGLRGSRS